MPDEQARPLVFARTDARPFVGRGFGVLPEDLTRHLYILGRTGTGKTTLLERLVVEQIRAGHGVGLIDPHGDLAARVLEFIPRSRSNDVLLFEPADTEMPVGFNVLACASAADRPLVAAGVLASFRKTFKEFWGPRLEHVLRNALLALLAVRGATLLGVLRMFTDARFRESVVRACDDPLVRYFWQTEFAMRRTRLIWTADSPGGCDGTRAHDDERDEEGCEHDDGRTSGAGAAVEPEPQAGGGAAAAQG